MNEFEFVKTRDGSTGLYNNEVQDIYHSSYGAFCESVQKFIVPSELIELAKNSNSIKILDICYGIGYNSKTAFYFANQNNKNISIDIDAIEINNELVLLSPFIKDFVPSIDLKIFLYKEIYSKNVNNKLRKKTELILKDNIEYFDKITPSLINFNYNEGTFVLEEPLKRPNLHNIYYMSILLSYDFLFNLFVSSTLFIFTYRIFFYNIKFY